MNKRHLELTATDRRELEALLSKGQLSARQFKRATGLLELDRGKTIQSVCETLGINRVTVRKWRDRYQQEGLAMLTDKPRPGRPIEIDGGQRAKVTALACSDAPTGHARWTLRLLANRAVDLNYCKHLSHTQVREILKKMP
ncbi:helix-turn-helix domain-containing protein [Leptothoe kymatousa]|uniref:Helix-turn-helix domain-containing protein n=1 Tax=Leptothoe kymatousa TAU-MAC 1615 TaxID=2364775 RepID=A0ABS5Y303_9CYAN|nr:helix-turn-helix domain-containing protein [Leptothoe kymatousa]MBT9312176.1 helix-turn-helix domain-containing protein [Leptothoe kymatousa TAU-MAC 1615]